MSVTKKEMYGILNTVTELAEANGIEVPEEVTFEEIHTFIEKEVESLNKKAESAKARAAAKRAEGDALRQSVLDVLSTEEFMTAEEIVAALGDPDVTKNMVIARLAQLGQGEKGTHEVEKDMVTIEVEGGKPRKVSAYRKLA